MESIRQRVVLSVGLDLPDRIPTLLGLDDGDDEESKAFARDFRRAIVGLGRRPSGGDDRESEGRRDDEG